MSTVNTNEWYVFGGGTIDKQTCNKIWKAVGEQWQESAVDTSKETTDEERKTGRKVDYKPDSKIRISDIAWCKDQWLYDIIFPFMGEANDKAGWSYDIKYAETCQITRYTKGGFYNFHVDGNGDHLSAYNRPENKFLHGHVRKLSMSIMLNDNFEGGAFEFASYAKENCTVTPIEAEAGSIIIFPSSMEHRVAPITQGTRYSVVCWFLGPPFV